MKFIDIVDCFLENESYEIEDDCVIYESLTAHRVGFHKDEELIFENNYMKVKDITGKWWICENKNILRNIKLKKTL